MSHLDVEDGLVGYVDALKDTGEWFDMTEKEQKQSVKNAAIYFDKIFHGILEAQIATLQTTNPNWLDGVGMGIARPLSPDGIKVADQNNQR